MLSHEAEEILETLWINFEEKKCRTYSIEQLGDEKKEEALKELADSGSALITSKNEISLTEKGREEGRNVVRRHRLAERLLVDVLNVKEDQINETACEFEHIIHKGIDNKICALLGHPRSCPHGYPIPRGECCRRKEKEARAVSPLSELSPGQTGNVAYIQTSDSKTLQKITALGVLPGMNIRLLQNFPAFLFETGNSQFAIDEEIAKDIFVRIMGD